MKKINYLLVLTLIMVLMNTNCTKDETENNSDSPNLSISKIADNQAMENPLYIFEYDTRNLLIRISSENQYSSQYYDIVYNTNKQPVKVTHIDYYLGNVESITITNIQWNSNGFVISDEDDLFNEIDTYEVDTKGRVVKRTNIFTPQGFDPETTIITANWVGEESMNIPEYSQSYKYIKKNNPFLNINLAVLIAADIAYAEWEHEFQNSFCVSEYEEDSFDAETTYIYNDQNFPVRADIKYTSGEGISHDYLYFEYESQ